MRELFRLSTLYKEDEEITESLDFDDVTEETAEHDLPWDEIALFPEENSFLQ